MDDIEKIRKLVALVSDNELAELELEEPDFRIKIKSQSGMAPCWPSPSLNQAAYGQPGHGQGGPLATGSDKGSCGEGDRAGLVEIVSPMVGTLYRSPGEGADPYVTVGDTVEPDMVVCIVEAMKVMNEVKAEVSGVIEEVLVQNAEPVEYNQVLFLVRADDGGDEQKSFQ